MGTPDRALLCAPYSSGCVAPGCALSPSYHHRSSTPLTAASRCSTGLNHPTKLSASGQSQQTYDRKRCAHSQTQNFGPQYQLDFMRLFYRTHNYQAHGSIFHFEQSTRHSRHASNQSSHDRCNQVKQRHAIQSHQLCNAEWQR